MQQRVCPRPSCAELNPPTEDYCQVCGTPLVILALGDVRRRPSVMDDPEWVARDQARWHRNKLLEEKTR